MSDVLALARDLLRCPSVTPQEGGALALIERVLGEAGFATHRLVFSDGGGPPIDNLYARLGTSRPHLLFAGHTDVVPPGDEARWTLPPFAGEVRDGFLYGRGAVDMKGAVACFVAAVLGHLAQNGPPKGSIGFLITGDEEGEAVNGTVKVLDWMRQNGENFDHCLLGEPTNPDRPGDMIKIGRRGSLTGRLTVHGKQGHVAYPHLAVNPVRGLTRLLAVLQDEAVDEGTTHFGPSTLEFSTVDVGNPASNVIPGEARAVFNVRFNDRWDHASLAAMLRERCERAVGASVDYELVFNPSNAGAFLTEPGPFAALVSAAVEAQTGRKPAFSTTGGTSDARFIKNFGPVLEYGLVGQTMHQIDERVAIADLEGLTSVYRRVIADYFSANL